MSLSTSTEEIEALFTRASGEFVFARWGRPIAPIVFGIDPGALPIIKGAIEAMSVLSGHPLAEVDPELGSNLMMFFFGDWDELLDVNGMDQLLPDLPALVGRLKAEDATQYRMFRFDDDGAIQAAFNFVRMNDQLAEMPADTLALGQAAQLFLLWSNTAFSERSPLAQAENGTVILRPEIAALIRVAYDPAIPAVSKDPALCFRLLARMGMAE